jgi:hypothetical protein
MKCIKKFIVDSCESMPLTLDELSMVDGSMVLETSEIREIDNLEIGEEWYQDMGEPPIKRIA